MPSSADWAKRIMKLMKDDPPPLSCVVACRRGAAPVFASRSQQCGGAGGRAAAAEVWAEHGGSIDGVRAQRGGAQRRFAGGGRWRRGTDIEAGHGDAGGGAEDFDAGAGGLQAVLQGRGEDGVGELGLRALGARRAECQQAAAAMRRASRRDKTETPNDNGL